MGGLPSPSPPALGGDPAYHSALAAVIRGPPGFLSGRPAILCLRAVLALTRRPAAACRFRGPTLCGLVGVLVTPGDLRKV